jgi:TP901 family phage tail tape measure protein
VTDANVRVNLSADSSKMDAGFKSAEASARAMAAALDKLEKAERAQVQEQMRASSMMASDFAKRGAAAKAAADAEVAAANRRKQAVLDFASSAGKGLMTFGAATLVGLGLAAKAASDWETAWAGVQKVVDPSTTNMKGLEQQLLGLSKVLPVTAEEIARVAATSAQLGVSGSNLAAFTETAIRMGATTTLSAEDAATGLAKLGNVMGNQFGANIDKAGSALLALGNYGASTEQQILDMSVRIAGAAHTVGMSEADVMGFANALTSVGIEAEAGGTAFSRLITDMASAASQGGDSLTRFANVAGMSAKSFATEFKTNATGAVEAFIAGLGRTQKAGGDLFAVLDDLGIKDVRMRQTLLNAASASDMLAISVQKGGQAWAESGDLVEASNKKFETSASRMALARNELNLAAISIGGAVLPALSGLATDVGTVAEAFNGLSPGVKQSVGALGTAVGVLTLVGGAALFAVPKLVAFRAALETMGPKAAGLNRAIGSIGSVLSGPWGAALGLGVLAVGLFAKAQIDAARHADEFAATLDKQTGAVTDNSRAWAANRLEQTGGLAAAKTLGVSGALVTSAMLGQADAVATLNDVIAKYATTGDHAAVSGMNMGTTLTAQQAAAANLKGILDALNPEMENGAAKADRMRDAMGGSASATDAAGSSASAAGGSYSDLAGTVDGTATAVDDLKKALDGLNNANLDARASARAFQQAIDDASGSLKENGKSLDITTEKGRKNQAALDGIAESAAKQAQALLDEGDSEASFRSSLEKSRGVLIAMAVRFGMTRAQAKAYADQVLAIPAAKNTTITSNVAQAKANMQSVLNMLHTIPSLKSFTVTANTASAEANLRHVLALLGAAKNTSVGAGTVKRAGGGYIPDSLGSGVRDDVPAMLTAGEFVVRRAVVQRNRPMLEALNAGASVSVNRFADGGLVRSAAVTPTVQHAGDTISIVAPTTSAVDIVTALESKRARHAAVRGRRY